MKARPRPRQIQTAVVSQGPGERREMAELSQRLVAEIGKPIKKFKPVKKRLTGVHKATFLEPKAIGMKPPKVSALVLKEKPTFHFQTDRPAPKPKPTFHFQTDRPAPKPVTPPVRKWTGKLYEKDLTKKEGAVWRGKLEKQLDEARQRYSNSNRTNQPAKMESRRQPPTSHTPSQSRNDRKKPAYQRSSPNHYTRPDNPDLPGWNC